MPWRVAIPEDVDLKIRKVVPANHQALIDDWLQKVFSADDPSEHVRITTAPVRGLVASTRIVEGTFVTSFVFFARQDDANRMRVIVDVQKPHHLVPNLYSTSTPFTIDED